MTGQMVTYEDFFALLSSKSLFSSGTVTSQSESNVNFHQILYFWTQKTSFVFKSPCLNVKSGFSPEIFSAVAHRHGGSGGTILVVGARY